MGRGNPWSRKELLVALNLYFKLPFGQQHSSNPQIIELAERLGRSPGSVNMKLNNFAAIDPDLEQTGLSNYSKKDEEIWEEYWQNIDRLASESEAIYEELSDQEGEDIGRILERDDEEYGTEESSSVRHRKGQSFFREVVLTHYNRECAICQLSQPGLLDASHIVDWSNARDRNLRVDPRNGILLCAIHHRAFDSGDIVIRPENYTIALSNHMQEEASQGAKYMFKKFEGQKIFLPERLRPKKEYLERKID